jgi:hypothetical protein
VITPLALRECGVNFLCKRPYIFRFIAHWDDNGDIDGLGHLFVTRHGQSIVTLALRLRCPGDTLEEPLDATLRQIKRPIRGAFCHTRARLQGKRRRHVEPNQPQFVVQ